MSQFNGYIIPLQTGKRPMQMMFQKSSFKMTYVKEIFTSVLLLPCVGGELNMIITLPDENTDLKMVMSVLSLHCIILQVLTIPIEEKLRKFSCTTIFLIHLAT
jgi:hypothetical protein